MSLIRRAILAAFALVATSAIAAPGRTIGLDELVVDARSRRYADVAPGDTVGIGAGRRGRLIINNFRGEPGRPITFVNRGGVVAIAMLDARDSSNRRKDGIAVRNCAYVRITGTGSRERYGITITDYLMGINVASKSTDVEVDHVEAFATGFAGIMAKTEPSCNEDLRATFVQRNTIVHDNYVHDTKGEGLYVGSQKYLGQKVTCNGVQRTAYPPVLEGVRIYDNIIEDTGWDGIQAGSIARDGKIFGNRILRDSRESRPTQKSGIFVNAGSACDVYSNFIMDGNGPGIVFLGHEGMIYDNVIVNAGKNSEPGSDDGIFVDDRDQIAGRSVHIVQNTIINPNRNGIRIYHKLVRNSRVQNNIIVNPGAYGLWQGDRVAWTTPEQSYIATNHGLIDPRNFIISNNLTTRDLAEVRFANPSAGAVLRSSATSSEPEDYALRGGSPAIDTGADLSGLQVSEDFAGHPRPRGRGYDIGAFEYQQDGSRSDSRPRGGIGASEAWYGSASQVEPAVWRRTKGAASPIARFASWERTVIHLPTAYDPSPDNRTTTTNPPAATRPAQSGITLPGLQSNEVGFLDVVGGTLWLSAGRTLSSLVGPGLSQFDWVSHEVPSASGRADETVTAFAVQGRRVAVATAHIEQVAGVSYSIGDGIYLSTDGGANWEHFPITTIFRDREKMAVPGGDLQSFGMWFAGDSLWAAYTSEFLAMTPDLGATWCRYRPDSTNNPQPNPFPGDTLRQNRYMHLNYRAFDVLAKGNEVWSSTNAGVNRTTDGGATWVNFDAGNSGLAGDFVPSIAPNGGTIWAATQGTDIDEQVLRDNPLDRFHDGKIDSLDWDLDRDGQVDRPGRNGISWTTDHGATWRQYIPADDPSVGVDFRAWDFTFDGPSVWVAGTTGGVDALLRSDDSGATWRLVPLVSADGDTFTSRQGVTDVACVGGVLWAATQRGLARSADHGRTWALILRFLQTKPLGGGSVVNPAGVASSLTTYAFPSPCAPRDGETPQIVFALTAAADVTIHIYDVGGAAVQTIRRADLPAGNHTVTWNGRTSDGRFVANGIYFYRITTSDGRSALGKMMVLN